MLTPQRHSVAVERSRHAGDAGGAQGRRTQLTSLDSEYELARIERESLSEADELEPHDRDAASIALLRTTLSAHTSVQRAWLTRKHVEHFPDDPLYLLFVEFSDPAAVSADRLQRISEQLPCDVCAWLIPSGAARAVLDRAREIDGALIFHR